MVRNLVRFTLALIIGASLANGSQAAPGDRARSEIQQCRQRIEQADGRIREIVRDIASAGSPQAVAELNRQLKQWETERAAAQANLVRARQVLDNIMRQEAQLKSETDAFVAARNRLVADVNSLRTDGEFHNQDAAAQRAAVQAFNARPGNQRTQAEADRLNFWRDVVNARRDRLQNRQSDLQGRAAELQRWESRILELARQLNNS